MKLGMRLKSSIFALGACVALSGVAVGCGDDVDPVEETDSGTPEAGKGGSGGKGGSSATGGKGGSSATGGKGGSSATGGKGGSSSGGSGGAGGSDPDDAGMDDAGE